jgi:hypothetical protein
MAETCPRCGQLPRCNCDSDFDVTVLPSSNHDLGYPLEGMLPAWGLTVHVDNKRIPVAFSKEQAIEIARRITEYY